MAKRRTIELLTGGFGNSAGEIVRVQHVDEAGNVYYNDGFDRYVYVCADEEGIDWRKVDGWEVDDAQA